jgi:hypothetical protein
MTAALSLCSSRRRDVYSGGHPRLTGGSELSRIGFEEYSPRRYDSVLWRRFEKTKNGLKGTGTSAGVS